MARILEVIAFMLIALPSAFSAKYLHFDPKLPDNIPNVINDDKLTVTVEMDLTLTLKEEGIHPQKFYFVPDTPPRAEPRLIVLVSSGQLRLYESLSSDASTYSEFLDIKPEVYWNGFHSIAFDPEWPAQPYIYGYYVGYTNIQEEDWDTYPNKQLNGERPPNWNVADDTGGCWLMDDYSNYNLISNTCPAYRTDTSSCTVTSFLCEMFSRIDRFEVNVDTLKVLDRTNIYGSFLSCGSYWGHLWSNIMFLSDGSLVFGMGDHAIDSKPVDPGNPLGDMCYNTEAGAPQGQWNTQRDHTDIGKFLRVFPEVYRDATKPIERDIDYEIIARGGRNPYSSTVLADDTIWIGDVGNSKAERIYHISARGSADDTPVYNMGWPCLEGELGEPLGSYSENARAMYLIENGFDICDPIYKAAGVSEEFFVGSYANTVAEPNYLSPSFEYRDIVDTNFEGCRGTRAAISGIIINEGDGLGLRYSNKLFFSDHSKRCLFFGTINKDGDLTDVRALMEKGDVGISHLLIHPVDGRLLMLDYEHARIISISGGSDDPLEEGTGLVEITEIPDAPKGAPPVSLYEPICTMTSPVDNMETLVWTDSGEGYFEGSLEFGAVQWSNKYGDTRSRGYNGMIPGPVIRMKACNVYKLTLFNNFDGWPNSETGSLNSYHKPLHTNLHTHGLHISGMGEADNVLRDVVAGEEALYTFAIPCDHAGGTHFYHPHSHGAVSLQAGGGAVGMLIIEDNPFFEALPTRPAIYGTMPIQNLVFQYMDPVFTTSIARTSGDEVYQSTSTKPYYLINGCDSYSMTINSNRWTRLRMLHVSRLDNAIVSIRTDKGEVACKSAMIAKDGVYSNLVGREITSEYFFSVSGRADVAIYCDTPGKYRISIGMFSASTRKITGTINVVPGKIIDDPELPLWKPCRPFYLADLRLEPMPTKTTSVLLTEGVINGMLWSEEDTAPIATIKEGSVQAWTFTGTDLHPSHMHINHVQLQKVYNWDMLPHWFEEGDWLDTISAPNTAIVRFRADRHGGNMLLHCHIFEHSDMGMVTLAVITGGSEIDSIDVSIKNPSTCSTIPACPKNPVNKPWCPNNTRKLTKKALKNIL